MYYPESDSVCLQSSPKTSTPTETRPGVSNPSVTESSVQKFEVNANCKLRDFIEKKGITFNRGQVFYELKYIENISEDKKVIIWDEVIF